MLEKLKKSETEIEAFESIELKCLQENETDSPFEVNLDHINKREINDQRIQVLFKRSRQKFYIYVLDQSRLL